MSFPKVFRTAQTLFLHAATVLILVSCGSGREIEDTDRQEVLKELTQNVILPGFEIFRQETDSLLSSVNTFTEHPDQASLESARYRWKEAAFAWKRASTFSFGPVEDNFLIGGIDYPSVHYPNIEKNILSATTIDERYISSKGSSLKGLKAIEYLLFRTADPDSAVADFTASEPRRHYLLALAGDLSVQARKVPEAWNSGNPSYAVSFVQSSGRDIKSSLGMLVNKCASQINLIKDERIGAPLGMRNGGPPQPELVEGRLSKTSLALLGHELEGIRACFGNAQQTGLSVLLDQAGAEYENQPLSQAISDQFEEIKRLSGQIALPLDQAIVNDTEKVKELYNALKKLRILLEVDVVNHLGIILTFSDNDGD